MPRRLAAIEPLSEHPGGKPPRSHGPKRVLYTALAGLFFTLGALGAVLPGLPATPFLLLTSYFLVRSWPGLNERLLQSRFFGSILRDWQEGGGVRPHVKVQAIVIVALTIAVTLYFASVSLPYKAAIAALALCGIVVIARLPVVK